MVCSKLTSELPVALISSLSPSLIKVVMAGKNVMPKELETIEPIESKIILSESKKGKPNKNNIIAIKQILFVNFCSANLPNAVIKKNPNEI